MTPIHYRPLSYICEQGSEGHNLHVLVSGSVRVTRSERGVKNSIVERDVGTMGPGAYFGEVAMLDQKGLRTHNIISVDEVTTYSLSRENFDKVKDALRPRLMKDIALRGITNSGGEIEAEFELEIKEDNLDKFRSIVSNATAAKSGSLKAVATLVMSSLQNSMVRSLWLKVDRWIQQSDTEMLELYEHIVEVVKGKTLKQRLKARPPINPSAHITNLSSSAGSGISSTPAAGARKTMVKRMRLPTEDEESEYSPGVAKVNRKAMTRLEAYVTLAMTKAYSERRQGDLSVIELFMERAIKKAGFCRVWAPFQYTELCRRMQVSEP